MVALSVAFRLGFTQSDQKKIEPREARFEAIPEGLCDPLKKIISRRYPRGLYGHQAQGVQAALAGKNVCLATSTASGKSDVFMLASAHIVSTQPDAEVLVLYPAKALILDQIKKWSSWGESLDFRVGYIYGGVPMDQRSTILRSCNIVLMTPDVAHAWLMSHLSDDTVARFLRHLKLLVLDEAHVYDGVFGTNMAFFLRRFQVVAGPHQVILATATLGKPEGFVTQLTGRDFLCLGLDDDGSPSPLKTITVVRPNVFQKPFDSMVQLLREMAAETDKPFLAFGDSRLMVEKIVAACSRKPDAQEEDEETTEGLQQSRILPYRAGYEDQDRQEIQNALSQARLKGVVSTSALELGLDIGEIGLTILLGWPPTMKSFWQRLGRAGRRDQGECLIIDARNLLQEVYGDLSSYLQRPLEPSWLYLENRYLQYANAVCAVNELQQTGLDSQQDAFDSLPSGFRRFLDNEINPQERLPSELLPLRERAAARSPHLEFPIRSGNEQNFEVIDSQRHLSLGNLTFPQMLREGYPGAVYYYMAKPFRVYHLSYQRNQVWVHREKFYTTRPISLVKVFPDFVQGVFSMLCSENGFVCECGMQVSERVQGFWERRGQQTSEHRYGPRSEYYQRDLNRFFETTGVCWQFEDSEASTESLASIILSAFCMRFGVQERDLGIGSFYARRGPIGEGECRGMCIFDATQGSLRLTQRLAENFVEVARNIRDPADGSMDDREIVDLQHLLDEIESLKPAILSEAETPAGPPDEQWVTVVANGQRACHVSPNGVRMFVETVRFYYTPQGMMYELRPHEAGVTWRVASHTVEPISGETELCRYNLMTGETVAL